MPWSRTRAGLLPVGLTALGLCLALPAFARDLTAGEAAAEGDGEMRLAQAFGHRERGNGDPRYFYVRSRDLFGKPGPVYRVLGVERPKRKRVVVDRHKARAAELLRRSPPAPPTTGPLLVAVSLAKQQLTLFDGGVPVARSPVSTGTARHPTPTGVFSVIQKQWWHRSNLYSSAPMPFMQRLTWSGIALHAGVLPGYPASHGCIRLPDDFAVRIWGTTRLGARVIITQGEVAPVEIAHPRLFSPMRNPDPAPRPKSDPPELLMVSHEETPENGLPSLARLGQLTVASVPATAGEGRTADEGLRVLAGLGSRLTLVNPDGTPITDEFDAVDGDDADDDGDAQLETPVAKRTITIVRPGQPDEVIEFAERTATKAPQAERDPGTITVLRAGRATEIAVIAVDTVTPTPRLAMLPLPVPAEQPLLVAHNGPALAAARLRRERRTQPLLVPNAPMARPLRPGPITVFVSRKERRLFVRKGFEPLFDAPVTIASPERPFGHHVFTAMSVTDSDARWSVVSLPVERIKMTQLTGKRAYRRGADGRLIRKPRSWRTVKEVVQLPPPASAREVLDRIEMPADAVIRITQLLSTGATLIVSDEGLGRETGRETDFTVLTK